MTKNTTSLHDLEIDLHNMQKTLGSPFDNDSVQMNPILAFAIKNEYLEQYKKVKTTIDPLKIVWIDNHYSIDRQKHLNTWAELLHWKERTQPHRANIKESLKDNPYYYFNGDMYYDKEGKANDIPKFYCYRDKYYMTGSEGNHRTVIGKYLWYFNRDKLEKEGYKGIKTYVYYIDSLPYKIIALHKLLVKYTTSCIKVGVLWKNLQKQSF